LNFNALIVEMKEDIERLYLSNVRLSVDAYNYLMHNEVDAGALKLMLNSLEPFLSVESVKSAIAQSKKIPVFDNKVQEQKIQIEKGETVYSHKESPQTQDEISISTTGAKSSGENSSGATSFAKSNSIPSDSNISKNISIADSESASSIPNADANAPKVEVLRVPHFSPIAKEYSPNIKIHEHRDISGQSRCMGTVEDFVAYFRDRYKQESGILRNRSTHLPIVRLDQLSLHTGSEARIIVMVTDKRVTSKGNLWLEVEDDYGSAKVMISSKEPSFKQAGTILRDDVVALDGKIAQEFFIAKTVSWPDLPVIRAEPKCEQDLAIAYLSDLHLGSRYFLDKPFKRFLRWLKGEEGNSALAGKVKYIVIAGDVVDGIGVYPSQEKELTITDIYAQYAEFDKVMQSLPDYIEVIMGPGNHDAVRRGEPQPLIPMDMVKSDIKKIGSPSSIDIEGFNHLVYHGTSLDSIIANMSGLSYAKPEGPMLEMLKRRHLSPIYGENLIIPELRDFMVISQEPDVVHMGHIHKNASMKYRGTLLINSGTFQDRTDFQAKMGHIPSPAITPVLELKSQQLSHIKFLEETL